MVGRLIHLCSVLPPVRKVFYKYFYEHITKNYRFEDWTCMNLGYASLGEDMNLELEPTEAPNRFGFQLYHHVASGVELQGRKVLEMGCGRGGGAYYVARRFRPASMVGMDFSSQCVRLASGRYHLPELSFKQGDAEAMPFDDGSFDVMINIESSHCYGNVDKFLSEARRVLRPDGHLLLADFRDANEANLLDQQLERSGMKVLQVEDITPNVIRSLDLDSERKRRMFASLPSGSLKHLEPLAAIKGSRVFEAIETGKVIHRSFIVQNSRQPSLVTGGGIAETSLSA